MLTLSSSQYGSRCHQAKLIELMLASDPAKRPSAKEISESDCLKKLRETVERSGTETIPLHPSAGTVTKYYHSWGGGGGGLAPCIVTCSTSMETCSHVSEG